MSDAQLMKQHMVDLDRKIGDFVVWLMSKGVLVEEMDLHLHTIDESFTELEALVMKQP